MHYHVPIFAERLDEAGQLLTTRPQLEELMALVSEGNEALHAEIETYTWDAIPQARREELELSSLTDCLEREFCWAMDQLEGSS